MSRFLQGDWGLKLLSLLLAVVLWVYVANEQNPTQEREYKGVSVEMRGLGRNMAVLETPRNANIQVQANRNVLSALNPESIEAFIDLTGLKAGRHMAPVEVKVPAGVKVTSVTPQEVFVTLEVLTEKQVPVKVHRTGQPEEGYKVLAVNTKPDEIIVRGPKSLLDKIDFATIDVSVHQKDRPFGETVPVRITDISGNFVNEHAVSRTPQVVDVIVSIVPEMPSKSVRVIPAITGEPAQGYRVSATVVDPSVLVVTGERDVIEGLSQVATQPIDITGMDKDVYADVRPELPEGVEANSQSVKVLVKIEQLKNADESEDVAKIR